MQGTVKAKNSMGSGRSKRRIQRRRNEEDEEGWGGLTNGGVGCWCHIAVAVASGVV